MTDVHANHDGPIRIELQTVVRALGIPVSDVQALDGLGDLDPLDKDIRTYLKIALAG